IEDEYEPLAAVTDPVEAVKPGAPALFDAVPNNVVLDWALGDPKAVDEAFAKASRIVAIDLAISRVIVNPIEPRSVIGEYDPATGRYTIHRGTQGVFAARAAIAASLNIAPEKLHVVTQDVGGSFGMKGFNFPEHALVPWAAQLLGRPVKW